MKEKLIFTEKKFNRSLLLGRLVVMVPGLSHAPGLTAPSQAVSISHSTPVRQRDKTTKTVERPGADPGADPGVEPGADPGVEQGWSQGWSQRWSHGKIQVRTQVAGRETKLSD